METEQIEADAVEALLDAYGCRMELFRRCRFSGIRVRFRGPDQDLTHLDSSELTGDPERGVWTVERDGSKHGGLYAAIEADLVARMEEIRERRDDLGRGKRRIVLAMEDAND